MDWTTVWELLEALSRLFYDPVLFWSAPLLPAIALELWRRHR